MNKEKICKERSKNSGIYHTKYKWVNFTFERIFPEFV